MASPDWYSLLPHETPLPGPSTGLQFGYPAAILPSSVPLLSLSASDYASQSSTSNHDDYDDQRFSSVTTRNQIHHLVSTESSSNLGSQNAVDESDSFENSSGPRSTPSDLYDENAENIDPNSREGQEQPDNYPISAHPRPTNILRDSQAYPVLFTVAVPGSERISEEAESIAAPVPLPYSARSKEVLSAMISPAQPAGFPRPVHPEETRVHEDSSGYPSPPSLILPVSETDFSSNASNSLHYSYSRELAQHTIVDVAAKNNAAPKKFIRPISPSTLIALTEPYLMAWCVGYPMPQHAPPPVSHDTFGY
ncbi:hypothetical protein DFH07DRAFT_828334 [Mycena maculata]|uniref:Uncharacterized protein n=1 Tax=Mycena maculata TaxID=230809 RepID=A0AAD7ITD0_9AGAR|nr:hypothetical protein DFH07DRAFT_828334 [Mycena maculata]